MACASDVDASASDVTRWLDEMDPTETDLLNKMPTVVNWLMGVFERSSITFDKPSYLGKNFVGPGLSAQLSMLPMQVRGCPCNCKWSDVICLDCSRNDAAAL
eukprot:SAG31_NODE_3890_length_3777_cov_5.473355_2_plen_102_part_00